MKFLIVGCGSIGERHTSNLKRLGKATIDVYDVDQLKARKIVTKYSVKLNNIKAIDNESYDCVFICTPPKSHVNLAIRALRNGSNIFIEKPLSPNLEGIEKLRSLVKKTKLLAFVGYNLRFNKGVIFVKKMIEDQQFGKVLYASATFGQYLPDWRPLQDYRKTYTAKSKLGGGIILDGSHEVDYLRYLFGNPTSIQSEYLRTHLLDADSEGLAEVILRFQSNILAHIHMDFVRREYRRTLELICEKGLITWSLAKTTIETFDSKKKVWHRHRINESVNDMYLREIEHVTKCIRNRKRSPIIDLENGISTLKASLSIKKAGSSGKRIIL